jgi:putative ABC transport system permease protein
VVILTALGEGARRYVSREFETLGSNLVIVVPGKVETTGGPPIGGTPRDITLDDFQAMRTHVTQIQEAAPLVVGEESVRYSDRSRSVPILGTTAEFLKVRKLQMASGRFLAPGDPERGGSEMVIGTKVARELFGPENPLGRTIRMGSWRFRVVGVLDPRGVSLGFDLDDVVFIPVKTCMSAFSRTSLFRVLVEVRNGADVTSASRALVAFFADRHRSEDVTVFTQDTVLSAFSAVLNALTLALAGIASVSLAVAGVGIMNVMLVSVTERRSEIGLLKALGVTRSQVVRVFLAEAVLLSGAGGAAGLTLAALALRIFRGIYPSFPAAPPLWAVLAALGTALGVGLVFGLWPAWRASKLDPVAALARR